MSFEQMIPIARRDLLAMAVAVPLAASCAKAWSAETCADLDNLPPGQQSLRKAVQFQKLSPYKDKVCSGCNYFTASSSGCGGECAILSEGPVHLDSYCSSWAAKR